ncbi:MAG: alpha/beta hydrolase [Bdellovibrionaceae bacterium]|nr:alpha/beta hydrolase [Bdellovibrionales bacterium]MCB9254208.1 alpha/beta hydrolase [Pseudobdellovibrionaceae bacterium]
MSFSYHLLLLFFLIASAPAFSDCAQQFDRLGGIHYLEKGSGQPIVLIHGASSNLHEFLASGMVEKLAANFHVIAIDRPGMGLSDPPADESERPMQSQIEAIEAFIEAKKLERPVLLGHSLGAAVAMGLAVRAPQKYRGVVSVAGAISPVKPGGTWYTALTTVPVIGTLARYTLFPVVGPLIMDKALEETFSPNEVPNDYRAKACVDRIFNPKVFRSNALHLEAVFDFLKGIYPLYDTLADLRFLLLYGRQDTRITAEKHVSLFQEKHSNPKVVWFENTGHLPQYSHLDEIIQNIGSFFAPNPA